MGGREDGSQRGWEKEDRREGGCEKEDVRRRM